VDNKAQERLKREIKLKTGGLNLSGLALGVIPNLTHLYWLKKLFIMDNEYAINFKSKTKIFYSNYS